MSVKELAETVILQSIEDLWDKKQRDESSSFFCGYGFSFWADAAGMTISDRQKVLSMILDSVCPETDSSAEAIYLRGVCLYKSTHNPKQLKEAYEN